MGLKSKHNSFDWYFSFSGCPRFTSGNVGVGVLKSIFDEIPSIYRNREIYLTGSSRRSCRIERGK